ncbi:MAG TPA: HNH endonuclease signature motif containing protein [Conexibacter sp.]|nr:HNH endonuclease signature motif containing protein [Conexibacter sp.]
MDRTRKVLWTRAANRCAICKQKLTMDPRHGGDRIALVGNECHIVATNRGGARSSGISRDGVDDYTNLILLCASHHKLVDDQPGTFTVDRLLQIKGDHERWVDEALDWRTAVPEDVWARILSETPLSEARDRPSVEDVERFAGGIGIFVRLTAELLRADEVVLFVRGDRLAWGVAYRHGQICVALGKRNGFRAGFDAIGDAPARERHIQSQLRTGQVTDPFDFTADRFSALTGRVQSSQAACFIRSADQGAEFAFYRGLGGVELGAGPPGTFRRAYASFARAQNRDITDLVGARLAAHYVAEIIHDDARRDALFANLAVVSVRRVIAAIGIKESLGEVGAIFDRHLRNRAYEGMLMLRVATVLPDNHALLVWATNHADSDAPDGLSSVLPDAGHRAVRDLARSVRLDEEDRADLGQAAYLGLTDLIELLRTLDEDEAPDALVELSFDLHDHWEWPELPVRILKLARQAKIEGLDG